MKKKKVTVPKELSTDYQSIVEDIVRQSGNRALRAIAPGEKLTQEEAEGLVAELKKFLVDHSPEVSITDTKISIEPAGEPIITKSTIRTVSSEEFVKLLESARKREKAQKTTTFEFTIPVKIPISSSAQPAFELIGKLEEVIKILELAIEKSAEGKKR